MLFICLLNLVVAITCGHCVHGAGVEGNTQPNVRTFLKELEQKSDEGQVSVVQGMGDHCDSLDNQIAFVKQALAAELSSSETELRPSALKMPLPTHTNDDDMAVSPHRVDRNGGAYLHNSNVESQVMARLSGLEARVLILEQKHAQERADLNH